MEDFDSVHRDKTESFAIARATGNFAFDCERNIPFRFRKTLVSSALKRKGCKACADWLIWLGGLVAEFFYFKRKNFKKK